VLDRAPEAGGVPRFCGHSPYGLREFRRPMLGPAYARALAAAARAAGAEIRTGTTATALHAGPAVDVTSDRGTGGSPRVSFFSPRARARRPGQAG
jgi:glycine/D-amino acid oxidase-like deaminating enzyme